MNFLRSVSYIINFKTVIITSLSVAATWYCLQQDIHADFPLTLVGIAIVFPIVFSINSAYKRRERALLSLAEIRGYALGIYRSAKNQLDDMKEEDDKRLKSKITSLFEALMHFLQSDPVKDPQSAKDMEREIYQAMDKISIEVRQLRALGLQGRFAARLNQYLTRLNVAVENMMVIFYYRTPRTLRAYSKVFLFSFPVLYSPYFAQIASDYVHSLGYVMPILFSFILVSLDNIQEHLENPYDQVGEDDIKMDMEAVNRML